MADVSHRVLKAVGLFGGTQIVTILCSIVRSKLVAIWIGAAGFGLLSIYLSVLDLLGQVSSLGIRNSAVRDIAANSRNRYHIARVVRIVGRWGVILGTIGFILTALLSPLLSIFSFGNTSYTVSFILLGLGVAMNAVTGARLAVLQGLSRLRKLSRASAGGAVAGLVAVVPMYYFWRLDSILPSILVFCAVSLAAAWICRERLDPVEKPISRQETVSVGSQFLKLGFFLTVGDILNQLAVYAFISWLNIHAGEETVGFYQAGNTLFNRYVGLIFSAIAMEYYPRLAAVCHSPRRVSTYVSHEIKMSLWLLLPTIAFFIALAPWIVELLYAREFEAIVPFVTVAITGTTLRAVSWCMAIVIVARGDGRRFLVTEGMSAVVAVCFNIWGYKLGGLVGLGVSYVLWYLAYTIFIYVVYRRGYGLRISGGIPLLFICAVLIVCAIVAVTLLTDLRLIVLAIALLLSFVSFRAFRRS